MFDIRSSRHRMLDTSLSAALFNRTLRTRVPTFVSPQLVNPDHQLKAKAEMAEHHDSRRGVRQLPSLQPGSRVIVQDGYCSPTHPWRVVQQYGRQVGVTDGSRLLLRNRQHVREFLSPSDPVVSPEPSLSIPTGVSPGTFSPTPPAGPEKPPSSPQPERDTVVPASPSHSSVPASSDSCASPSRHFRDGAVTRSGRQVKFTERAKAGLA